MMPDEAERKKGREGGREQGKEGATDIHCVPGPGPSTEKIFVWLSLLG